MRWSAPGLLALRGVFPAVTLPPGCCPRRHRPQPSGADSSAPPGLQHGGSGAGPGAEWRPAPGCGLLRNLALASGVSIEESPTTMGLIGGGPVPMPGEVSLAYCGILFLNERPEFRPYVLKVLCLPLEQDITAIAFPVHTRCRRLSHIGRAREACAGESERPPLPHADGHLHPALAYANDCEGILQRRRMQDLPQPFNRRTGDGLIRPSGPGEPSRR